jgi:hypothetical protein
MAKNRWSGADMDMHILPNDAARQEKAAKMSDHDQTGWIVKGVSLGLVAATFAWAIVLLASNDVSLFLEHVAG